MITLENNKLSIKINELGAEVTEGKKADGKNFIWMGAEDSWSGHSPVLFPICGRLVDGEYFYEGKSYKFGCHGFAPHSVFKVIESDGKTALFSLKYDEETLKVYPFKFEFKVRYTLNENTVTVNFETVNLDSKPLLFSAGAHEGFYCEDEVENYYIEFDKPVTLDSCTLKNNLLSGETEPVVENSNRVYLKSDTYRAYDLIFRDIDVKAATLFDKNGKKMVRCEFADFPHLLFWSVPGGHYVCIEPWCGLPDFYNGDKDFKTKPGLIKLEPGKTHTLTHSYTVY